MKQHIQARGGIQSVLSEAAEKEPCPSMVPEVSIDLLRAGNTSLIHSFIQPIAIEYLPYARHASRH